MMKMVLTKLSVLVLAGGVATVAWAQNQPPQGPTQPVPTRPSVNLTMDHKHALKETLLKDDRIKPETSRVNLEPGSVVPTAVLLRAFPEDLADRIPQVRQYNFFKTNDAIVLVQPRDRAIVEVIKQ